MKKMNGRRRQRGQGRRQINNINKNTVLESNGPISNVRGNISQLVDKYCSLASDAQANDDKILYESYLQFADHYYRLNKEVEAAAEAKLNEQNQRIENNDKIKDQNSSTNNFSKPSRKERSIIAKEKEERLDNKVPKKLLSEKSIDIS